VELSASTPEDMQWNEVFEAADLNRVRRFAAVSWSLRTRLDDVVEATRSTLMSGPVK
jgi:hypothetical protein